MSKGILCVDDEEFVLVALSQDLRKHFEDDFLIELAESAEDGLEVLEEMASEGVEIVVIISDWMMPGMKGDEFLIEAHKRFPTVIKVLLTGQADKEVIQKTHEQAEMGKAFHKPWDSEELVSYISKQMGAAS